VPCCRPLLQQPRLPCRYPASGIKSSEHTGTGAAATTYVAQRYDTLRGIARSVYGDETLWYVIAEANALPGNVTPPAGSVIEIPSITRSSNTANTFQVFNPAEAIGDTSPAQVVPPPPPSKGGCGALGTLIMVVVAVAVTIATAGAAGPALISALGPVAGAAAAGAVGAAAGSIVSQGVGIAIGAQDKFSWRQVGLAAVGGAVGGALNGVQSLSGGPPLGGGFGKEVISSLSNGNQYVAAALRAATSSVITQGIASVTGAQSFSWRAVAVSAIAAPASQWLGNQLLDGQTPDGFATRGWLSSAGVTNSTLARGISGTVNAALTQSVRMHVYNQGKLDWAHLAADAFGNAIGNSVVESVNFKAELRAFEERLRGIANRPPAGEGGPVMLLAGVGARDAAEREADELLRRIDNGRNAPERALAGLREIANAIARSNDAQNAVWRDDSVATNTAVTIGRALNNGVELAGAAKDLFVGAWNGLERFGSALANADYESAQRMAADVANAVGNLPAALARKAMGAADVIFDIADTAQIIAADPQMRGEVHAQAQKIWGSMGRAQAALGTADLLFNVGLAVLGGTAARAAGEVVGQANTARVFAREARVAEQADDLFARLGLALTDVAAASLTRGTVARALRNGMSSEQLSAVFGTQAYASAAARGAKEGAGVLQAIVRMENQGWALIDKNFQYGKSGHGIDLVFERPDGKGGTRYAVTEAKAGLDSWRGKISLKDANTQGGPRMQGSKDYNIDRLTNLSRHPDTPAEMVAQAQSLLDAYDAGRVENYASFARSDRLIRIDDSVLQRSQMQGKYSVLDWIRQRRT
jgi:hypothetical protein